VTTTLHPARAFIAEHGTKLLRYCGVSVVNVICGQSLLWFCLEVVDLRAVPSQIIAAMVSAIPAYILSRRWVWKQSGKDSFRTEVLPFWIIALVGLITAVTSIAIVEQFTENTIALMFTSFCAFGVVWVAKYIILDKVMWRTKTDPSAELAS
jgi:putative flippase GtrA